MARSKYPGFGVLYELGTKADIAKSYGVSERTVYRWLNKAKAETAPKRQSYPGAQTIQQFRGTRKELAQKFGISERTAYRWLNKAKAEGANIPSRQRPSRFPGVGILDEEGSNVAIGRKYGVSEATVRRWKKQAAAGLPEEIYTPEQLPQEIYTPEQLPEEVLTPEMPEEIITPEEPLPELPEEIITEEPGDETESDKMDSESIEQLHQLLYDYDVFVENSLFHTLDKSKQYEYLIAYINYQGELNPYRFYNKEIHDFDYSPEFVSTINMWGDEFETYLQRMEDLESFRNSDWMDDL